MFQQKKIVFTIRRKENIDKKIFYWLKNEKKKSIFIKKRFQRTELVTLINNFVV